MQYYIVLESTFKRSPKDCVYKKEKKNGYYGKNIASFSKLLFKFFSQVLAQGEMIMVFANRNRVLNTKNLK